MKYISIRSLSYIALLSALSGVVLMSVRFINLISFSEPLQITASGAEYESLYVVWKYINGLTLFTNHFEKPFAGTFYNWAYYAFYGELTKLFQILLNLEDAWIPTITKIISFIGLFYGSAMAYLCFSQITPTQNADSKRLNIAFALFVFFGPLVGFFGVSLSPDIWALAFDVTAILVFLKNYEKFPFRSILLTCLFAYLAWGFKQIFIFTPAIVGTFLLVRRDWKWLIFFSILMWAGWILTLALGGQQYLKSILMFGGTKITLDPDRLMRNILNGMPKLTVPFFGILAIILAFLTSPRLGELLKEWFSDISNRPSFFACIGIMVASIITFPASAKQGAAENYYFTLSFFLILLIAIATAWLFTSSKLTKPILALMICGWVINLLGVGSVLAGINGKLSNYYFHKKFLIAQKCLRSKARQEPIFIDNPYLSLPWIYPTKEHFVVQTSYKWDRTAGINMKEGGLGGLMDKGYFSTLALNIEKDGLYDGSNLSLYERTSEKCNGFTIYIKKT
jgi:hypothetical protein